MSEQVQFHKGTEINLPGANIDNAGHLFHCEDTKNTYLSNNGTMELFSSAVGARQLNGDDEVGGMAFGDIDNNIAYYTYDEAHGIGTQTAQRARPDSPVVVLGKYNDEGYEPFVIGNGTSNDDRSDLFVVSENWGVRYKDVQMNPLMLYGTLDEDDNKPIVRVSRTNYDDGLSWNLFEKHFFTSFHAAYLELSLESWGWPNPARLPLIEEYNEVCTDATEMFHRFSGPMKVYNADAICTVTWRWDSGYIWDVELTFLSPIEIECAYEAGDAPLQPIGYPPLMSSALYKFWHRGFNGNGHYYYTYRHRAQIEVDEETWYFFGHRRIDDCPDKNTIYRASKNGIGEGWTFRAIDDVSYPTPKMKHATTNNYNLQKCPSFNAPVLLGNLRSQKFNPAATYRYMSSVHNKDNPILADLASGAINAPGGFHSAYDDGSVSIITSLMLDQCMLGYAEPENDETWLTELTSGSILCMYNEQEARLDSTGLSLDNYDNQHILNLTDNMLEMSNGDGRLYLTAGTSGSVLSLGCNGGNDYAIKSYIESGNPTLTIRCDSTNEQILTSYASTTQIHTPNCIIDGLQVDSGAHFLEEVTIDGGAYIDGLFESGSGVYSYDTVYAEGNITSENNIYAQGDIDADGTITGNKVYGAVWNDYAEFRTQTTAIEPGYCVTSSNNGLVSKTTEKLQACDGIVSDTYGFAIGETDECQTPLAVAGRVLAYCEGDRNSYNAGDTVCAGPDGKVCKMTREEIREWPDRIVGIVSEIPNYETWGSGNISVNGRIWIKIK